MRLRSFRNLPSSPKPSELAFQCASDYARALGVKIFRDYRLEEFESIYLIEKEDIVTKIKVDCTRELSSEAEQLYEILKHGIDIVEESWRRKYQ